MGSVVVLLHSTGHTQVISSSQEGNTTQQGHGRPTWREREAKKSLDTTVDCPLWGSRGSTRQVRRK